MQRKILRNAFWEKEGWKRIEDKHWEVILNTLRFQITGCHEELNTTQFENEVIPASQRARDSGKGNGVLMSLESPPGEPQSTEDD